MDFFDDIEQKLEEQSEQNYKSSIQDGVDLLDFDPLKLYFGDDYQIGEITIHQPTIGEIIEFSERKMYSSISPFTGNSTSYRLQLWELGIDWNDYKDDFKLFYELTYRLLTPDITSLIFGDFNFQELIPLKNIETDTVSLYKPVFDDSGNIIDTEMKIDEIIFIQLQKYLRIMFNQHPKVQFAKGKSTKKTLIRRDKEAIAKHAKESSSTLLPLISSCVNHPGFKYKKNELREVGIVEFMDSVNRLQVYEQSTAFLKGMYSGFMDTSKLSEEQLNHSINWLRDLSS